MRAVCKAKTLTGLFGSLFRVGLCKNNSSAINNKRATTNKQTNKQTQTNEPAFMERLLFCCTSWYALSSVRPLSATFFTSFLASAAILHDARGTAKDVVKTLCSRNSSYTQRKRERDSRLPRMFFELLDRPALLRLQAEALCNKVLCDVRDLRASVCMHAINVRSKTF